MSFPGPSGPASSGLSVWRASPVSLLQRELCVLSHRRSSCRRARGRESARIPGAPGQGEGAN